jgi:hypothetical protein
MKLCCRSTCIIYDSNKLILYTNMFTVWDAQSYINWTINIHCNNILQVITWIRIMWKCSHSFETINIKLKTRLCLIYYIVLVIFFNYTYFGHPNVLNPNLLSGLVGKDDAAVILMTILIVKYFNLGKINICRLLCTAYADHLMLFTY